MEEKRAVLRRRTYFEARLSSQDGIGWAHGVVRNLSDDGALVETASPSIPDLLELSIAQTGLRVRSRVAWRDGARAGLRFEPPPAHAAAPRRTPGRSGDDPNY